MVHTIEFQKRGLPHIHVLILMEFGDDLTKHPNMPLPNSPDDDGHQWLDLANNPMLASQLEYDPQELQNRVDRSYQQFNHEQKAAYDAVMESVNSGNSRIFFIHSAGGCGKTYLCNTIAATVRAQGHIALCVASSGIAVLLLEGGRTAHSCFKIPIPIHEDSVAGITRRSQMYEVLCHTKVIIWDEVPMQHKHGILAVDKCLRDLLDKRDCPFGGITVVFGGDFRQTLPVVPQGSRQDIIDASICRSILWNQISRFYLVQNMRLEQSPETDIQCHTMDDLTNFIYPDIQLHQPDQYFLDRTVLSSRNDEVDDINAAILERFPGEKHVLMGADSIDLENADDNNYPPYPMEYLNSLNVSGLPLAKLVLKVGCPIMLLRNLDPSQGLCNGTHMRVLGIHSRVLHCKIISGDIRFANKEVMIPRIQLSPSAETLPIPLKRHQFPVHLAFVITINKSQGQSVKYIGINLQTSVFSHSQLYVAFSCCTSHHHIRVLLPQQYNNKTINVVYKEVLGRLDLG
ncbi:ATP-dependent DNA helicase PIF1 [Leucoagaricus sp. SymC.cos]|nr:ATP-dependent DNA helicase PIF1 [Leucoagaricus sp. SymC.cos]